MADKTVTVRPSGGDYTTLAAAITGEVAANADLVTMDGILNIIGEGTWSSDDTTAVTVSGFTADASHYVNIDFASATGYKLAVASGAAMTIPLHYTRVKGVTASSGDNYAFHVSEGHDDIFDSCRVPYSGSSSTAQGIQITGDTCIIINCVILTYKTAIRLNRATTVMSCTLANHEAGIWSVSGTSVAKNCYISSDPGHATIAGTVTITTVATSDDLGSVGLRSIAYSTSNFSSVTAGSENLSLVSGSGLIGVGTDLRSDATWPFDYDIVGTTRGATWDVGAFEYVAAAASGNPWYHYAMQA